MLIDFLINLMNLDSTSGQEELLGKHIRDQVQPAGAELEVHDIENGKFNLFYKWGKPEIIFCTHFDTVPPYIPPRLTEDKVYGRGSCDAKGQIACLYHTCLELHHEGNTNFGLLLLAGEEVGSYGAKASNKIIEGCKYVIIGEPTENKLIKAAKGNILVNCTFLGKSCHSGYAEHGDNAIDRMIRFIGNLNKIEFPDDKALGKTTFNIGRLHSDNAHNVVSDCVTMKIFFRTTFESHPFIMKKLQEICDDKSKVEVGYADDPLNFAVVEGFETDIVSYGSDAPELGNLGTPLMYGPGSILNAHTKDENIVIEDMYRAIEDLKKIYLALAEGGE
jgi:acetylornithine deacetylase